MRFRRRDRDERRGGGSRRERDDRDDRGRKGKFKYQKRSAEDVRGRADQRAGMFDSMFKPEYKVFAPKPGNSYSIRILPPTWEDAKHYAYDVYKHSMVGADSQRYACPKHHKNEPCPVCEESDELKRAGEKDAAYEAKAKRNCVMWIIDRDDEKEGPQIWAPSWVVDRDLSARCISDRTKEVLYIDDPDKGYDVDFKCEKKGKFSEIVGIGPARRATPISDDPGQQDEWLDYINENPIPETIKFYSYDHISKTLAGGSTKKDDEDEDEPRTRSERRRRDDDDDDESPRSRRSLRDDDDQEEGGDEPPKRSRASSTSKRRYTEDDELDEDVEDEDDRDEDDRRSRSKRRRDEEDDDDDERGGSSHGKVRKDGKRRSSDNEREGDDDEPSPRRHSDRDDEPRRSRQSRSRSEDDEDGREDVSDRRSLKKDSRDDEEFDEDDIPL